MKDAETVIHGDEGGRGNEKGKTSFSSNKVWYLELRTNS